MPTINSRFYLYSGESPILKASYEFIKKMLAKISGIQDIPVVGSSEASDINRELGRVTQDIKKYPYINIMPTQIEDNPDSYNQFTLKKYGNEPMLGKDNYWYTFHLRPCLLTFTCAFYTQDFSQALNFMANWHFNSREGTFKLKTREGFEVDITVNIEPTANFPERDFGTGNPLRVETTFTLKTYTGYIYKVPNLDKVEKRSQFVSEFEVDNMEELLTDELD